MMNEEFSEPINKELGTIIQRKTAAVIMNQAIECKKAEKSSKNVKHSVHNVVGTGTNFAN